jgi:hypothetical protein
MAELIFLGLIIWSAVTFGPWVTFFGFIALAVVAELLGG